MRYKAPPRLLSSQGVLLVVLSLLVTACSGVIASDPPKFEEVPKDQTVINDRVASFTCRAAGNPHPTIEWRKNGKRIAANNNRYNVIKIPGGSILRIEPVKFLRDDSELECVAENSAGDTISAKARLEVLSDDPNALPSGFPFFRTEPKTKAVEIDHTALLVCDARGNPDPVITWYKDHRPVDVNNPRYSVLRSGSLQISTSTEEDGGKYECVAENSVGTAFSSLVSLYVRVRRVQPRFTRPPNKIYEVMPGENLNISCVAVGSPMPYVQWKKGPAVDVTDNVITKNVLVLTNIREKANYTCVAQSTLGIIQTDVQIIVQALPRPPSTIRISDVMATSVRITWAYETNPGDISYYVIRYKPRRADREYAEISGLVTKFYTVIGLTPFTEYEFQVRAVNKIGIGPPSEPAHVTTGETEPGSAPRNVHVRPLSSSTMVIQWDEPQTPNGPITGYKLYYTTNPSLPIQSWKSQPVQDNKLTTISDLTPHTVYSIRVLAYTGVGPGPLSEEVRVKTQQGVPSQPTKLHPARVTATSIELVWTAPSHQGENIVSYQIYWNSSTSDKTEQMTISKGESYTLNDLKPNTIYNIWLAAKSERGEGAATSPISVRTDQDENWHSSLMEAFIQDIREFRQITSIILLAQSRLEERVCKVLNCEDDLKTDFNFPLSTEDDYKKFHKNIYKTKYKTSVILRIAQLEGNTVDEYINNTLTFLFHPDYAYEAVFTNGAVVTDLIYYGLLKKYYGIIVTSKTDIMSKMWTWHNKLTSSSWDINLTRKSLIMIKP